jgi:AraC-like DNA-binding protein
VSTASAEHERIVREAITFIERNLGDRDLGLEVVGAELHVSARQLGRLFQAVAGTTFSQHVFERRMDRARELLEHGDPARQVAGQVGYGSGAALAKAFRRRYGVVPHEVSLED